MKERRYNVIIRSREFFEDSLVSELGMPSEIAHLVIDVLAGFLPIDYEPWREDAVEDRPAPPPFRVATAEELREWQDSRDPLLRGGMR